MKGGIHLRPVIVEAQEKLVPEMMAALQQRYLVLKLIKTSGPIGRRPLAETAGLTERETRSVMEALRDQHLILVAKEGARVTSEGERVLYQLEPLIELQYERNSLAKRIRQQFGIKDVHIVKGDSSETGASNELLGAEAASVFAGRIGSGRIVAVTGGSTMAAIPKHLSCYPGAENTLFIPARGGVGEDIGLQANVIAATFAQTCNASYKSLYYPESLSEAAHAVFLKEPSARKMLELYETTDCLMHGIGDAKRMAIMRESDDDERRLLASNGAKGEAFGYYFNRDGDIVHRLRTVGIQTEHLDRIPLILAVAGGSEKSEAILSYLHAAAKQTVLITDEGAAREIVNLMNENG
ncbi:sugar-binding transcriptional regulator [Sporosarcina sp. NCCP-2716]|uniref:sugar-binding transcriptional regulator n=1 Tax=Sporosarcina sp. NCCP-2716 TaxID=2943679 RepID=UPI002040988D|nr:sugar-binding domain-containing protein [Sporosarcina sp. NCCP-2716]GKV69929.1 sugar-binding transcriptional regulator [Sporosarcina sp. NCCP-2716]